MKRLRTGLGGALVTALFMTPSSADAAVGFDGPTRGRHAASVRAGSVISDGQRFVAFEDTAGRLRVLDTQRGRVRSPTGRQSCDAYAAAPSGLFLLTCPVRPRSCEFRWTVFNARSGRSRVLGKLGVQGRGDCFITYLFTEIGRRWLAGTRTTRADIEEKIETVQVYDWQADRRAFPAGTDGCGYDLDQRRVPRRRPCPRSDREFLVVQREGRLRLSVQRRGHWGLYLTDRGRTRRLTRRACGSVAIECHERLSAGWVTWLDASHGRRQKIRAYDARGGRSFHWTASGLLRIRNPATLGVVSVDHTAHAAVVQVAAHWHRDANGENEIDTYRLYVLGRP